MLIKILGVVLLLNCSASIAQNSVVYRWVDKNNVVHFSHEHPADIDFAEVKVHVAYTPPPLTKNEKPTTEQEKSVDISHMSDEAIKKNCEAAKTNLSTLNSFENILVKDADGNDKTLTDEEKLIQIEQSKKYVGIYCGETQGF